MAHAMSTATTAELARRTGLNKAMASRLRNGLRSPSVGTLSTIITEFDIPDSTVAELWEEVKAANGSAKLEAEAFGRWLRAVLFDEQDQSIDAA